MDGSIIDRSNYLNYAENSTLISLYYLNNGLTSFLFNEPLWLIINSILSFFLSPENTLRFIIFFSSFTVSFLLLKNNIKYFWILLIILIFPSVIKNFIVHIRQGLAISLFLIGWFSSIQSKRYLFFLMSPFVHSSFFIVVSIYLITVILKKIRFAFDIKLIVYLTIGLTVSFGLGFIASSLDMRQANVYQFNAPITSGLGFLFWFLILLIYLSNSKEFLRKHSFVIGMMIFYLITYFFIEVSARVFESVIILVLFASLELKNKHKVLVIFLLIMMIVYKFLANIGSLYMGYSVI
jgi:hypothetical protein